MFLSAYQSVVGEANKLGLKKTNTAIVVLVDGLGVSNLSGAGGHAPFLNSSDRSTASIDTVFPSTTSAAITSFATGVMPGAHGTVGYQIFDHVAQQGLNLLTGQTAEQALARQTTQTITERAQANSIPTYFIGPPGYENSGFTNATMRGAKYLAGKSFGDRVDHCSDLMKSNEPKLIYCYFPELDQNAHAHGTKSRKWTEKLEDLDAVMKDLHTRAGNRAGVVVTADHGIVDVAHDKHIFLDDLESQLDGLKFVGGDPRVSFLYFENATSAAIAAEALQVALGKVAYVVTKQQMIDSGWYGELSDKFMNDLPEVFVLAKTEVAFYHRKFAKTKSMQMVGQHGSISPAELKVPLIRLGAYA